jgi:mitogen-activated protein kinase 8 interacting protein 3
LREEVRSLQEVRAKLQTRVQDLEDEVKRLKDEAEKGRKEKEEEDEEVPMAQRKRFTR